MAWTVTRQLQWPEGDHVVEISYGGLEYINPDMLVEKYAGEGETYDDPRDAVEAAVEIAQEWQQDAPNKSILIGYGSTGGMTLPLEGEELSEDTFIELKRWAAEAYEKLPKCSQCGEILPAKNKRWINWNPLCGEEFCSERCVQRAAEAALEEDYSELSDEEFDQILLEIGGELSPKQLLGIPGIYEILSEEFNNEILDRWETKKREAQDDQRYEH